MEAQRQTKPLTGGRADHAQRILWIDIAKGIAMLLVFYGHLGGAGDNPWFPNLTGSIWVVYLFHMPLFFMLSGLTFHPNKDFRTFFISRFKRLVIPYFFFSIYALGKILLLIVAPSVVQGFHAGAMGTPLSEIGVILLGNTNGLWFFLTLFWGELFLYGVNKLTKQSIHRHLTLALIALIASVAWFAMSFLGTYKYIPFQLLHATEAVAFVGLGWLLSHKIKMFGKQATLYMLAGSTALFIIFGVVCRYTETHDVGWWIILASLPYLCAAVFGSLMTIAIAQLLPSWHWLTYIGRNTMIFYGLNGLSMAIARKVVFMVIPVSLVAAHIVLQIIIGLLVIAVACLICTVATPILNRWCWWGIGTSRPHAKLLSAKHVAPDAADSSH
ncbi:acyltransferase [Bifidobacterium pseudolongum]|uniref:acyltransferase family protein n=1 Tax=Bifidobacterium pseudolongum TaxID=1694 RepID=UPI001F103FEF|nr:acyltransferase [Bifidobacterium pseudolongum]MCH4853769.1 acyltransferase [Bifidobacterium pseudolongum]